LRPKTQQARPQPFAGGCSRGPKLLQVSFSLLYDLADVVRQERRTYRKKSCG